MAYTLTLLGTDTQFTPNKDENAYDRAETLSYISTLIHSESTMKTNDVIQFRNEKVCVINGPTTYGSGVYDRISRSVAAVLEAVSRGETNVSIIAHSRGAVEAILVAHELERIQNVFNEKSDAGLEAVLNSSCSSTKVIMNTSLKFEYENLNLEKISQNITRLKLSMLNIDPVPGGNYIGITRLSTLAWRDPRFYELPKIVQGYEQYIYENERTRCFKPIVPKPISPKTKFKLNSLPGHHGTGSGNLKAQQRSVNSPSIEKTKHVQELVIANLIDFLNRNGVELTPKEAGVSDPFVALTDQLLRDKTSSLEVRLKKIYFQLYNEILANKEAYEFYNQTSYRVLGQEQALARLIFNVLDQRIVHYQAHNDTYLPTIIPPVPGNHFLNFEHARMHLNKELGLSDKNPRLSKTINGAVNRLLKICVHRDKLESKERVSSSSAPEPMSQSVINDRVAHTLNSNEALLLEAVSTLIEEVRQPYLQNKLVNKDERIAIYEAIKIAFKSFSRLEPTNKFAARILEKLKTDLKHTVNMKHDHLKNHSFDLTNKLKEKQFLHELEQNIQIVINIQEKQNDENKQESDSLIKKLKGFKSRSEEKRKQQLLSSEVSDFLKQEFKQLSEIILSSDPAKQSLSAASVLISEAIEKNVTYLFPQIIKEVIALSHELENFKKSLSGFKELDDSLDYEKIKLDLVQYRAHVIEFAAQYIQRNKIPLKNVKVLFSDEDEGIYKQIEVIAIDLGAINPDYLTICEIVQTNAKNSHPFFSFFFPGSSQSIKQLNHAIKNAQTFDEVKTHVCDYLLNNGNSETGKKLLKALLPDGDNDKPLEALREHWGMVEEKEDAVDDEHSTMASLWSLLGAFQG